jgi:prepilin-type N-terminal cleavage/methylation domain-containing protein
MRISRTTAARGFTMTELAIVLGIIGIILGAIWVAASRVYQNNKVQVAVRDAATIVQGYRSLFTTHAVDTGVALADETCLGVTSGFFPSDMILASATCTTGTTTTYPRHPWNNYVQVYTDQTYQGIQIYFANLTQAACNQLAGQLSNASDVIYENISGTAQYLSPFAANTPYTNSQINTACNIANNGNYVTIEFKAR